MLTRDVRVMLVTVSSPFVMLNPMLVPGTAHAWIAPLSRQPRGLGAKLTPNGRFVRSMWAEIESGVTSGEESGNTTPELEIGENIELGRIAIRLHKPIGMMLEEVEAGKPGLRVEELVEGGSAKAIGIVKPGMRLLEACGTDCTLLDFDKVVTLINASPLEDPIDFVFESLITT
ncbi:unnamed protein product [Choristocarpus tenellus]